MAQLFSHSNVAIASTQSASTVNGVPMSEVTVADPQWGTQHSFQVPTSALANVTLGATFTITISSP